LAEERRQSSETDFWLEAFRTVDLLASRVLPLW